MDKTILIVDDDKKIAELIAFHLNKDGYATHCVHTGREALEYVNRRHPLLVMLDIRLPDMGGVDVLKELLQFQPGTYVLMISAHADVKIAVECMKLGAYDLVEKPLAFTELDAKVRHIFKQSRLEEEVSTLKRELGAKYKFKSMLGKSAGMKKVFQLIEVASKSEANVIIGGESGTGKELVARAIHFNGIQKEGPFVALNCGAIPENLLESELFGHEKGAFTGAIARKIGKFEQAQGGTIFLDEIGDLPAPLQSKLLRVLQEREIERVGGNQPIPIHVRCVAATHQDLRKLVQEGQFREDLYFRINVFPIHIPPLRERTDDIPILLDYFTRKHLGPKHKDFSLEGPVMKRLLEYHWPGNVRELENFVERLMLLKPGASSFTEGDIEPLLEVKRQEKAAVASSLPAESSWDKDKVLGETEKGILENALKEAGGNVSKASRLLKISRDTFYRKMKKYSLIN